MWATPTPPPRAPRSTPWLVILACAVAVVLVGGVVLVVSDSFSSSPSPSRSGSPGGPDPSGPPTVPSNGSGALSPDQAVLRQLGLRQADLAAGGLAQLVPRGDQVVGETTLDLCNGTFPSESRRVARRQVAAVSVADTSVSLSTEAVFYDDAGGTAQAFTELRSVAAKCPAAAVTPPGGGEGAATKFNPTPDKAWPQTATVERLAYDFVTTDAAGASDRTVAVYLRRGRILIGIYFSHPDQPTPIAGKTTLADIVNVFASRLAKLPPSVITGHEAPAAVPGAV